MGRTRNQGKKIDTWDIWKTNRTVKVDVRIHYSGGATFTAECKEFGLKWAKHENLNQLKKIVEADIQAVSEFDFKPTLQVDIGILRPDGEQQGWSHVSNDNGTFCTLLCDSLGEDDNSRFGRFRGLIELDVEAFEMAEVMEPYRSTPTRYKRYGKGQAISSLYDKPDTGPNQSVSFIDDTPENRAALDKIFVGMQLLGEKLIDLLEPKKVQQSLKGIARVGTPLLPAGKETKAKRGK